MQYGRSSRVPSTSSRSFVQAGIFENNTSSMGVLEKCGFHLEAVHLSAITKDGGIMDGYLYALVK